MTIERKIQGYGYSKLVSLPKYWVEMQNIKKGDKIRMEITPKGNLILMGNKNGNAEIA